MLKVGKNEERGTQHSLYYLCNFFSENNTGSENKSFIFSNGKQMGIVHRKISNIFNNFITSVYYSENDFCVMWDKAGEQLHDIILSSPVYTTIRKFSVRKRR